MRVVRILSMVFLTAVLSAFIAEQPAVQAERTARNKITRVWLIGDSTVADYSLESNYQSLRYPIMGWGQVFQSFMASDSLKKIRHIIKTDSVIVFDKARSGRSTRSFFEEGKWAEVYRALGPGDVVLIQFGHNDASLNKGERYTSLTGYKEFLRLYVNQSREKGAVPILVTPVARNYPWKNGRLGNTHGDYPGAMKEVASELDAYLIDLNTLSMEYFSEKGFDYVTTTYFMNFPAGLYPGYPDGSSDNTHFQPAGATAVASLVFGAMKGLNSGSQAIPAGNSSAGGSDVTLPQVYNGPAGEIYRDIEFEPWVMELH
jgi:lysophospholipase L1-like esterase